MRSTMRPTLACLLAAAMPLARSADIHWDGGAGTNQWGDAANWSGDALPAGNDTVWLDDPTTCPASLYLNTSYPDTGAALNLVLGAGHDLSIEAAAGRELYLNSVRVLDAATYTLHVPRSGVQGASGAMAAAGAAWDIAAGGTLWVREDFGAKAYASGAWSKTGEGTLRFGDGAFGTLASPLLQFRALGGVTELNYILGITFNGIAEIAEGATVRALCHNPNVTLMPSGSSAYAAGVTGVAGTFDLNGHDQRFRALSGRASGRVLGNSGIETIVLNLGVGDLSPTLAREADGDFAGSIQDGASGHLRLVVHGARAGYTQTLSGHNSFTGGTVVLGGRLVLAHATDTLDDSGALDVDGGALDLVGNSETVGALALRGGDILGSGGTLRAAALTVDNAGAVGIGPRMHVDGLAIKRGAGTLTLHDDAVFAGGLNIEEGLVVAVGRTLVGDIGVHGAGLTGGTYAGTIHCTGIGILDGAIASGGTLAAYGATLSTTGLTVAGNLEIIQTRIEGGPVSVEGGHLLLSWFGLNAFTGGLTYGSGAVVDWHVAQDLQSAYVDGTTEGERGSVFGAIEVGGAGLVIADGARLRVLAPSPSGDAFWISPRTFKLAALMEGASITGSFMLVGADDTPAQGWSTDTRADGLYLNWSGMALPTPVPEAETLSLALGAGLLALASGRRARLPARYP